MNEFGETERDWIVQLSLEPLFTLAAVTDAFPLPSRQTVKFWQFATGGVQSFTVTVEVQVDELPEPSVAVSVTTFAPMFPQLNVFGKTESVGVLQLSEEALSTFAAVMEAFPLPSRQTVKFWQEATGGVQSFTVTVEVQVDELPEPSVTVSVTTFGPRFAQLNVFGKTVDEAMPQLSLESSSIWPALIETEEPSRQTEMLWQDASGGVQSLTVTVEVQVDELPD